MNNQKDIAALSVALRSVLRDTHIEEDEKLETLAALLEMQRREEAIAELDNLVRGDSDGEL